MKTIKISTITFLLVLSCGLLNAQTSKPKLNQAELYKKSVGTWETKSQNDTIIGMQVEKFGEGYLGTDYLIIKGVKKDTDKWGICYSKEDDCFKMFGIFQDGSYQTIVASFISENKMIQKRVKDLDPDTVLYTVEIETSPNMVTARVLTLDSKVTNVMKFNKIK